MLKVIWGIDPPPLKKRGGGNPLNLVGNCSATRYSVAAPLPGARQGFGGSMHPRHPPPPPGGRERCDRGLWGRGAAATPLLHTQNCGMSRDRGVATPWSATWGGCSVCPTKFPKRGASQFPMAVPLSMLLLLLLLLLLFLLLFFFMLFWSYTS